MEDITWPRKDTKFLLECRHVFHKRARQTSEIIVKKRREIACPQSGHVISSTCYINTNEITIYYVTVATAILSHVKITCHFNLWSTKAHLLFQWCFIGFITCSVPFKSATNTLKQIKWKFHTAYFKIIHKNKFSIKLTEK